MTGAWAQVWRRIEIAIALAGAALLLTMCGTATPRSSADDVTAHDHPATLAPVNATDFSVYDLPALWRDADDTERPLSSLRGRPQVMALVYTHCSYVCPRIMADMKRVEGELGAGADVGFVLVSIDPARDTPARLGEYMQSTQLDPSRWTLLTANDDAVQELAALLGVRYRRASETEYEHSNVLTVLDASGVIVHRQVGLGADPAAIVRVLQSLAQTQAH